MGNLSQCAPPTQARFDTEAIKRKKTLEKSAFQGASHAS